MTRQTERNVLCHVDALGSLLFKARNVEEHKFLGGMTQQIVQVRLVHMIGDARIPLTTLAADKITAAAENITTTAETITAA